MKFGANVSGLCHCATCRKLTGSAYSATANWHLPQFRLTGEVQTYERRQFCSLCGSRLFYLFDGGVEVFLGTLDQAPYDIKPMLEVWTVRREPGFSLFLGLPRMSRIPRRFSCLRPSSAQPSAWSPTPRRAARYRCHDPDVGGSCC
ncbi:GFA family protein [Rhizobium leguminosarum]|uniref:GFA family protein n=1 Tax=Rhizobium leguminosarum TaxID=384 RepID=UPI001FD9140C|nr:GFA family protein [Rhizobium leguminosarum]